MKIVTRTDKLTGRVISVMLEPDGASDEIFLTSLVHSLANERPIEVEARHDGKRLIYVPGGRGQGDGS